MFDNAIDTLMRLVDVGLKAGRVCMVNAVLFTTHTRGVYCFTEHRIQNTESVLSMNNIDICLSIAYTFLQKLHLKQRDI